MQKCRTYVGVLRRGEQRFLLPFLVRANDEEGRMRQRDVRNSP